MWRSFCYLYIYLKVTKVYGIKLTISVYYRIFLQIDRCSEIILATAKNKFRIICIEITICPVCRWCILKLSVSFTEFISSTSERLTAVPKFPNFFFIQSFSKLLYELRVCFNIIPSNYRPNNDMFISPVNVDEIDLLRLRSPISYCKTKKYSPFICVCQGNSLSMLILN